jgi:DNA-binding GntR family transcriptional regulator
MTANGRSRQAQDPTVDELQRLHVQPGYGSRTDAVTTTLREAILSGVITPGTWLREGELSQTLGVSRTPVREALRRLADEGLTVREVHRGSVVAQMSIEDILAVYTVRANLEGLAAELRDVHERMLAAAEAGESIDDLNLTLHRLIRESAHNVYLERFLIQVENSVRRFGQTTFADPDRLVVALAEHGELIEAIAAADEERAERVAVAHMRNAREVRLRQLLAE